jgi:hypothetical protein
MGRIFVVGTADTKGEELAYLRAAVAEARRAAIVVDFGIGPPRCDVDIARSEVAGSSSQWRAFSGQHRSRRGGGGNGRGELSKVKSSAGWGATRLAVCAAFRCKMGGICANSCWRSPALIIPHVQHPCIADASEELCRDLSADADHSREPHLREMVG